MPSVRSNRVVVQGELRPATVVFEEGVITDISPTLLADRDFGDLVVMPGLVDSHVHVNEPGRAEWEGFTTATRAAAAGGTTTIVDMPLNSVPPTTSVTALMAKRAAADGLLAVDVAFWGGLVPGSLPELLSLVEEGVCGFKAFLVDSGVPEFPPVSADLLREGLETLRSIRIPLLVHAEDRQAFREPEGDPSLYRTYLDSRPVESERKGVEGVALLARQTGSSAHILHVSSGDAAGAIANNSEVLTGETCPHYLTFAADEIPYGATRFKCTPPIRNSAHREALWDALDEGSLAMVVSDHSPAPPDMKEIDTGDFIKAWGGISSLQLRLPVTWTGASRRGVDLPELARWLSAGPARLAGLDDRKGSISIGLDADLVIWDPDGVTEVRGADLEHRHPITPYDGMRLRGRVVSTMLGGRTVFADGAVSGRRGRMLRRA